MDYLGWLELRNLSVLTEAALLAAGQRRESRGSHIRADYPGVDNHHYLCRLTAKLEDGRLYLAETDGGFTQADSIGCTVSGSTMQWTDDQGALADLETELGVSPDLSWTKQ